MPGLLWAQSVVAVDGLKPATVVSPTGMSITSTVGIPAAGVSTGLEPFYTAGSDILIHQETWESYNTNADVLAAYPANSGTQYLQFPSPLSPAHGGTKCMRMNMPVQNTYLDESLVLEKSYSLPATGQFCVAEWWHRTIPGYAWRRINAPDQNSAGQKDMFLISNSNHKRYGIEPGLAPSGTFWGGQYDAAFNAAAGSSGVAIVTAIDGSDVGGAGAFWYFQNMGPSIQCVGYLNDGNWHHWKIKYTCSSFVTSTTGDGKIEMWVDGTQVLKYDGTDSSRPEYQQVLVGTSPQQIMTTVQFPCNINGGPSPAQGALWRDYDDMMWWVRP